MAYEVVGFKTGQFLAGADLSALQYTAVKLNGSGQVVACTVLGEKVLGILQNKPTTGLACEIVHIGLCPMLASAAITAGDKIMVAASGKAATAATVGSTIIGFTPEAAAALNEVITVFVNCGVGVV